MWPARPRLIGAAWRSRLWRNGGKGRFSDNIFVERLWRTVKYEEVYLKAYANGREAKAGLDAYFEFYNTQRPHQTLGYRTPAEVFNEETSNSAGEMAPRRWPSEREVVDYVRNSRTLS